MLIYHKSIQYKSGRKLNEKISRPITAYQVAWASHHLGNKNNHHLLTYQFIVILFLTTQWLYLNTNI